jgi:hypothetical protein
MNQNIRSIQDYLAFYLAYGSEGTVRVLTEDFGSGTKLLNEGPVGETPPTWVRLQASWRRRGDRRPSDAPSCNSGRGHVNKTLHILSF